MYFDVYVHRFIIKNKFKNIFIKFKELSMLKLKAIFHNEIVKNKGHSYLRRSEYEPGAYVLQSQNDLRRRIC